MPPTAPPTSHTIVERAFTRNRKALSGVMPLRSSPFAWCPGVRSAECVRNRLERGARVGANRTYGGQAHDHDQRQHHGVLNRRGPVLRDEETLHFQRRALHIESSDVMSRESPRPRVAVRPRLVQKKRCYAWPALSRLRVARTLKPPMKPYVIAGGSQTAESRGDFECVIMPTSPVAGPAADTYI